MTERQLILEDSLKSQLRIEQVKLKRLESLSSMVTGVEMVTHTLSFITMDVILEIQKQLKELQDIREHEEEVTRNSIKIFGI